MKADFMKFVGPLPTDPLPYEEPKGARPLAAPDAALVCHTRLELAKREARLRAEERGEVAP